MSNVRDGWASRVRSILNWVGGGQSGQSLILFAVMLTTLVAGTGLVIDTGYAYQERRLAQNAADSAALGAAQYLAQYRTRNVGCSEVSNVIQQYATANLPGSTVAGSYLTPTQGVWDSIGDTGCTVDRMQTGQNPYVVGVSLTVTHTHNTFFMRVLNFNTVTVSAQATAEYGGTWQVPLDHVLPIILDDQQWSDLTGTSETNAQPGNWTVSPESPSKNSAVQGCPVGYYNMNNTSFETSTATVGYYLDITTPINCGNAGTPEIAGFDWGPLNTTCNGSSCSNSDSAIQCLMQTSCVDSTYANNDLSINDYVQISGGTRSVNFFNELQTYAAGKDMLVPLVSHQDIISHSCPNCAVQVKGFAWIHIVGTGGNGSNSYFTAAWDDPCCTPPLPGSIGSQPSFQVVSAALLR